MSATPAVPRLILVTDAARSRRPLPELMKEAVLGGVDGVYLRGEIADPGLEELGVLVDESASPSCVRSPSPGILAVSGTSWDENEPSQSHFPHGQPPEARKASSPGSTGRVPAKWVAVGGEGALSEEARGVRATATAPDEYPDVTSAIEQVREIRAGLGERAALLVNDVALAIAAGTGLHLRERDPIPPAARAALAPGMPLGRSVHSPASAAASAGVDYLLAGHVFPSASKPGKPPLGLSGLSAIVAAAPCPVLAVGGITAANVAEVVDAGAYGVAVIGAIAAADDPRAAAAALRAAIDRALLHHENQKEPAMSRETATTIEIVVNGKTVTLPAQSTIHDFLASKKMTGAMAIIERNGEIVPRATYHTTTLASGDRLEIVHAVGGG